MKNPEAGNGNHLILLEDLYKSEDGYDHVAAKLKSMLSDMSTDEFAFTLAFFFHQLKAINKIKKASPT